MGGRVTSAAGVTISTNIPIMDKGLGVIGRDDGLSVLIGFNCCYFFWGHGFNPVQRAGIILGGQYDVSYDQQQTGRRGQRRV